MKRRSRWLGIIGMLLLLGAVLFPVTAKAADYSVKLNGSSKVRAGETIRVGAEIQNGSDVVTDLTGLQFTFWADSWNDHSDGNDDAVIADEHNVTDGALVTLPSEGVYYIIGELYDENWTKLASDCLTITVTNDDAGVPVEDAPVEDNITVQKISFSNPDFIRGMDVSSLLSLEKAGVTFRDEDGTKKDLMEILSDNGVNYIRVRVWNDPYDGNGNGYGGGNNDVKAAAEIGRRAAKYGMKLLVDFHYSDFWADPGKQQVPKAWNGKSVKEKADLIRQFTLQSLETIRAAGAQIGMVQIGNETTAAICGESTWENMAQLFNAGTAAVREFDQNVLAAVHFTNPEKTSAIKGLADSLDHYQVDYDVFATSYYPYWHGSLGNLTAVLDYAAEKYGKYTMVAETSYAMTLADTDGHANTVRAGSNDTGSDLKWDFTVQGQADEVREVMNAVNQVSGGKGLGVFYWEGAWITVGDISGLEDEGLAARIEQNKELWEQTGSGWAASYAGEYDPADAGKWYGGSAVDNQAFFDAEGTMLPSLKVFKYVETGSVNRAVSVESIASFKEEITVGEDYTLPETVEVRYSNQTTAEKVAWDTGDIKNIRTSEAGTYTVKGTVTFSQTVDDGAYAGCLTGDTVYTLVVNPENILKTIGDDYSFENGGENFSGLDTTGKGIDGETPLEGAYCLHWYLDNGGDARVVYNGPDGQGITLPAGKYCFRVSGQGMDGDTISVQVRDENDVIASGEARTLEGWKNWKEAEVSFTLEQETVIWPEMNIGIQPGGWGTLDCMVLNRTGDVPEKEEKPEETEETKEEDSVTPVSPSDGGQDQKPADSSGKKRSKSQIKSDLNAGLSIKEAEKKVTLTWGRVEEADGYDLFVAVCNGASMPKKPVKTVSAKKKTTVTLKKLGTSKIRNDKCYRAVVRAYQKTGSKKKYIGTSLSVHTAGTATAKTNVRKIKVKESSFTLKESQKRTIRPTVVKENKNRKLQKHTELYRYWSDKPAVAAVNAGGRVTAKSAGKAKIYVMAPNGVHKVVRVTVKKK